jgi:hypothetical protein
VIAITCGVSVFEQLLVTVLVVHSTIVVIYVGLNQSSKLSQVRERLETPFISIVASWLGSVIKDETVDSSTRIAINALSATSCKIIVSTIVQTGGVSKPNGTSIQRMNFEQQFYKLSQGKQTI